MPSHLSKPLRIIFAGTPVFAAEILQQLIAAHYEIIAVYTQPDKPAGRGQKLTASPVKQLALQHHIPVFQPKTLREPEAQAQLAALKPDLMVVAAYGLILPQAVLDIPANGCINVHASILPRWRGAAPIQRAIVAGDTETGITIMQMEAGLDTGPMLYKAVCPINDNDNSQTLHDKLAVLGGQALLTALDMLQQGILVAEVQDDTLACYANKIEKAEAMINWQQPATNICQQIRGFNPWPMAQTHIANEIIKIGEAVVIEENTNQLPGTLLQATKHGIDIATSNGIVRLLSLQFSGHKMLPVADILNSRAHLFTPGVVFL
jgi:methionyl-tRNA formyltransferase